MSEFKYLNIDDNLIRQGSIIGISKIKEKFTHVGVYETKSYYCFDIYLATNTIEISKWTELACHKTRDFLISELEIKV